MRVVERDELIQVMHGRGRSPPVEETRQIGLELVEQHLELAVVELPEGRDVRGIDDHGAALLHHLDGGVRERVSGRTRPKQAVSDDTNPRALEPVGFECLRVVVLDARTCRRRGICGSGAASTVSSAAASATDRAIGPAVSWLCAIGTIPVRLTSPTVGLIPTSPLTFEGETIDPSVSVPTPTAARLAATATPVPELEPEGLRSSAYGIAGLPSAPAPAAG